MLPYDFNILVSIVGALHVVKAESVQHLVDHSAVPEATLS